MAVILDLFSRKVVGWKLGESLAAELVVTALQNALSMRTPDRGLYFHSDRGSQYSSQAVRKPLRVIGANLSMSGLGNCYDNAKAESFFSTLKSECLPATQVFDSRVVARRELFEYIETYYNNKRLHSALGYQSPRQFEVEHCKKGNNLFEENVSATPFQKRSEVQESKRNKCTGYPAVIHGCNGKHPKTCSVSL